jgi:sec-independent protein translocase protein TatB
MFDVGFWEILLILVLALVIIGPERLPGAARKAGYFVGKARRYIEGVRSEVESELDVGEFKRMLHNQEVQINELQQQLKSGVDEVKSGLPTTDLLTDMPSHSVHDEPAHDEKGVSSYETEDSAAPDDTQLSSTANKEKP